MIDEKDIEIAKLRGQVEALEKLVRTMIAAPQPSPQYVPMPYPVYPQIWQPEWQPVEIWTGPTIGCETVSGNWTTVPGIGSS